MSEGPIVVAVHPRRGLALLDIGEVIPLQIEWEGDRVSAIVAGPDSEGRWYAVDGSEFGRATVH